MREPVCQIVQVRNERDRSAETQIVCFAAGLIRDLGKVVLPPVGAPQAMAVVAHTRRVKREDDDAGTLGLFNRRVYKRVIGSAISEPVDAVGHHKYFVPNRAFRPTFDQVDKRIVGTGRCAGIPQRKP